MHRAPKRAPQSPAAVSVKPPTAERTKTIKSTVRTEKTYEPGETQAEETGRVRNKCNVSTVVSGLIAQRAWRGGVTLNMPRGVFFHTRAVRVVLELLSSEVLIRGFIFAMFVTEAFKLRRLTVALSCSVSDLLCEALAQMPSTKIDGTRRQYPAKPQLSMPASHQLLLGMDS
jgi:hypothetical protein